MSPKWSSLAFDAVPDQEHLENVHFEPDLCVVKPRHQSKKYEVSSANLDEVVYIAGRFTVSF